MRYGQHFSDSVGFTPNVTHVCIGGGGGEEPESYSSTIERCSNIPIILIRTSFRILTIFGEHRQREQQPFSLVELHYSYRFSGQEC